MSSGYSTGDSRDGSTSSSSGEESVESDESDSSKGSWDSDEDTGEEFTINKRGEEVHTMGPGVEVPDHLLPKWKRKQSPPKKASDEDDKLKENLRGTFEKVCREGSYFRSCRACVSS